MSQAKQETLFDHNPTDQEIYDIGGLTSREEYTKISKDFDSDFHYADIYKLYVFRNKPDTANFYLNKIVDKERRVSIEQGYPTESLFWRDMPKDIIKSMEDYLRRQK